MERHRTVLLSVSSAVVLLLAAFTLWNVGAGDRYIGDVISIPGEGDGRIVVEVYNGTATDGLARRMTRRLRDQGIDVVYFGSVTPGEHDSTEIIVRRGDTIAARVVRDALGLGVIVNEPAAHLLVDVTVLLGLDAADSSVSTRN